MSSPLLDRAKKELTRLSLKDLIINGGIWSVVLAIVFFLAKSFAEGI